MSKDMLSDLRIRVEEDPKDADAWCEIGLLLLAQGKSDEAKPIFEKVIQLDSKQFKAWASLGFMAANEGDIKAAEKFYKKSVKIESRFKDGWIGLARIYGAQKKFKDAVKAIGKCDYSTDEEQAFLSFELSQIFYAWERFSEAEKEVRKALTLRSADPILKLQLSRVLKARNEASYAELEREVIEGTYSIGEWFQILSFLKSFGWTYEKRIHEICDKILSLDPDNIDARILKYWYYRHRWSLLHDEEMRRRHQFRTTTGRGYYYGGVDDKLEERQQDFFQKWSRLEKEIEAIIRKTNDPVAKKKWEQTKEAERRELEQRVKDSFKAR